jgi:hypothetical protein
MRKRKVCPGFFGEVVSPGDLRPGEDFLHFRTLLSRDKQGKGSVEPSL